MNEIEYRIWSPPDHSIDRPKKISARLGIDHSIMVSSKPSSSKKAKASDSASKKVKGENFYHNAKTAGRLKMMKGGKPVYDRQGKMIQAAAFQKGENETTPGRVQPDRRWFGTSWAPNPLHWTRD